MTPKQIDLVQQSWKQVKPYSQTAGEIFYDRLLDLDPALESTLSTNHVEQIKKLMSSLNLAVNNLDDPDAIDLIIDILCMHHVGYGLLDTEQQNAQQAFCWALMHGLGPAFTNEVKEAWIEFFSVMSGTPGSTRLN